MERRTKKRKQKLIEQKEVGLASHDLTSFSSISNIVWCELVDDGTAHAPIVGAY